MISPFEWALLMAVMFTPIVHDVFKIWHASHSKFLLWLTIIITVVTFVIGLKIVSQYYS